ncbi:MAG: sulfite exporter TauE/SafE family protein [Thioalkalivibrionaceae bacterium]
MIELVLVVLAAFVAGIVNALAGGGTFVTFPTLVFLGVPPLTANASSTTALLPGYLATAWAYRDGMRGVGGLGLTGFVLLGLLGGAIGAIALLVTTHEAFRALVPWLLLFATMLFAFGAALQRLIARLALKIDPGTISGRIAVVLMTAYGGYFAGGMGIVMLAVLRVLGVENLQAANGIKALLSAVLTTMAVAIFLIGGLVDPTYVVPMAVAATAGGFFGAWLGRRIPPTWLRIGIIIVGLATAAAFFSGG